MNDLTPLLILLLISRARGGAASSSPRWPTALSPPPPPPAPDASPAEAMQDLLNARNDLYAAARKAGPAKTAKGVLRPAKRMKPIVVTATPKAAAPKFLNYSPEMDVSVADIQKAVIKRGAKIKPDGIFGPKTQAAWVNTAKKWKLDPTIVQLSSKIAKVNTNTFTTLTNPNRINVP